MSRTRVLLTPIALQSRIDPFAFFVCLTAVTAKTLREMFTFILGKFSLKSCEKIKLQHKLHPRSQGLLFSALPERERRVDGGIMNNLGIRVAQEARKIESQRTSISQESNEGE